jgi:VanZ family protein
MESALWALPASCAALTLWFSFGAPPPGASLFPDADKVGHAIAYFATTLSFLFAAVWRPGAGEGRFPRLGWWFPVAAIAAGGLIEILQGMTATRTAQSSDLVAEIVGTAAAVTVHAAVRRRSNSRLARAGPVR